MTRVFGQWRFMSPQEQTRTHIEKRLLSVWNYKIIKYTVIFFCVCAHVHFDVNKPNMDSRAERVKEKLYPLQPINFCSEFSSTLLVPFAVLGTPAEGYQKSGTVRFAILVPFTTSDSVNGNNCVPYLFRFSSHGKGNPVYKGYYSVFHICLFIFVFFTKDNQVINLEKQKMQRFNFHTYKQPQFITSISQ